MSLSGHRFSPTPSRSASPSRLRILRRDPLTSEVAKVDARGSSSSSELPVLSPHAYPTPPVSGHLCPVISAGTGLPGATCLCAASVRLARSRSPSPAATSVGTAGSPSRVWHTPRSHCWPRLTRGVVRTHHLAPRVWCPLSPLLTAAQPVVGSPARGQGGCSSPWFPRSEDSAKT